MGGNGIIISWTQKLGFLGDLHPPPSPNISDRALFPINPSVTYSRKSVKKS